MRMKHKFTRTSTNTSVKPPTKRHFLDSPNFSGINDPMVNANPLSGSLAIDYPYFKRVKRAVVDNEVRVNRFKQVNTEVSDDLATYIINCNHNSPVSPVCAVCSRSYADVVYTRAYNILSPYNHLKFITYIPFSLQTQTISASQVRSFIRSFTRLIRVCGFTGPVIGVIEIDHRDNDNNGVDSVHVHAVVADNDIDRLNKALAKLRVHALRDLARYRANSGDLSKRNPFVVINVYELPRLIAYVYKFSPCRVNSDKAVRGKTKLELSGLQAVNIFSVLHELGLKGLSLFINCKIRVG